MGLVDSPKAKLLLGGFLLSLFALVAVTGFGLLAVVSALGTAAAGESLVFALVEAAAPFVVAATLFGFLSTVLLVGLAVVAVRSASLPRDERLARFARTLERYFTDVRALGLSERLEPTTEDRIEELKQRYVEGEITEWEYEQRLQDLMSEEDVSDERVRRERNRTDYEFER